MQPELPRGVPDGFAAAMAAFAAVLEPPPPMDVATWANQERVVSAESGSPFPGQWRNELVPYGIEIMAELSDTSPARDVTLKKSAQVGGSEFGLNWIGAAIHRAPGPMLIVLPTVDEGKKYNRVKLQPLIDATPALRDLVTETKSRDDESSTSMFKRFAGGFLVVTGANSSAGLQMVSARRILFEEVSEYPIETGDRGDPINLALARGKAYDEIGPKRFYNSTPSIKGACRISDRYEASDQRRYYVPCPHCWAWQTLRFANLKFDSVRPPHRAFFVCARAGCVIEHKHKRAMIARGVWIKTYPSDDAENPAPPEEFDEFDLARWRARGSEGRQPGFAIWQGYSPFVSWDSTIAEWLAAKDDHARLKEFWQQCLGEPWEEAGEAPDFERLFERRQPFRFGIVPFGGVFITGAADVQGDRIEWDVYAWGEGLTSWLVDSGIVTGDTATEAPWVEFAKVIDREYRDAFGRKKRIDAFGIDAGFRSQIVYRFVMRHGGADGRIFALDGRPGWRLPPLATPRAIDVDYAGKKIGAVKLWPVGTWDIKAELYAGLRKTIIGPDLETGAWSRGTVFLPQDVSKPYLEQLTAEYLDDARLNRAGVKVREWKVMKGRANERHDTAVYNRALAHHLSDALTGEDWERLKREATTGPADAQLDLVDLWRPAIVAPGEGATLAPRPEETKDQAPPTPDAMDRDDWLKGRGDSWL